MVMGEVFLAEQVQLILAGVAASASNSLGQ
jgi:hypothetical protein